VYRSKEKNNLDTVRVGYKRGKYIENKEKTPARKQVASRTTRDHFTTSFHDGFLVGLSFDPEDGGDVFFRNVR
jgi:hypothetical protein